MQELIDKIAAELADQVSTIVLHRVRAELDASRGQNTTFCWSEAETAEILHCNVQTLAKEAKAGLIDHTVNPAGRRVYMAHHILDRLIRKEERSGKSVVSMAEVLNFRSQVKEVTGEPKSKAA